MDIITRSYMKMRCRMSKTRHEAPYGPITKLSRTKPFANSEDSDCFQHSVADRQCNPCFPVHNHQPHAQPLNNIMTKTAAVATPHANPFSSAHKESCTHSTTMSCCPFMLMSFCSSTKDTNCGHLLELGHEQSVQVKDSLR